MIAAMADKETLRILKQGVAAWNESRRKQPSRIDLSGADLSGANLSRANLSGADLSRANLSGANLSKADLSEANLSWANLSEANLNEANLRKADLSGTDLSRAALSGAKFFLTRFGGTWLLDASGLESCIHYGLSYLDYHTLARSEPLPRPFLRGCGLSETFIEYLRSLFNAPIQFHSLFISYSTKDQDFAERLHADLQNKGVRCWFAPHDIQSGKKIHEQIDEAILIHDRLLLILSPASMASEWVSTEIAKARKREVKEKRRVLFPIRLVDLESLRDWECFDADTGKDSAREIREYFIPDFSRWKDHDSYQAAFAGLLPDLKAEAQKA